MDIKSFFGSKESKIIIDNKTIVTFTGSLITEAFAKAWLKKKALNPQKFTVFTKNNEKIASFDVYNA